MSTRRPPDWPRSAAASTRRRTRGAFSTRSGVAARASPSRVRPARTHQRRWQDGRTLQRAPLNPLCEELYGAPHLTVHRSDLLSIIASGFPAARIHLGHRVVGFADKGDCVEAWFENNARITA